MLLPNSHAFFERFCCAPHRQGQGQRGGWGPPENGVPPIFWDSLGDDITGCFLE